MNANDELAGVSQGYRSRSQLSSWGYCTISLSESSILLIVKTPESVCLTCAHSIVNRIYHVKREFNGVALK